jgi:hypothetical protein
MAAGAVQRLRLKDLDAVLARAKAEGWTELDFYVDPHGPPIWSAYDSAKPHRVILYQPLRRVPEALIEITSLESLDLGANQIGV